MRFLELVPLVVLLGLGLPLAAKERDGVGGEKPAVRMTTSEAAGVMSKATLLMAKKKYEEAEKLVEPVTRAEGLHKSQQSQAWNQLAVIRMNRGNDKGAMAAAENSQELKPHPSRQRLMDNIRKRMAEKGG